MFRDLRLINLPWLAVFVGANGSGKSTLFDVFGFLHDALKNNVKQAIQKRGGFKEMISRGVKCNIVIELQFRLWIVGKERLVTYSLEMAMRPEFLLLPGRSLSIKGVLMGRPVIF